MFPIPWNFPLRKKNGNLVNIGDAIDGGTEIPEHDEGDAGKVLSVDESGNLEWSDEVNTEIQALDDKLDDEIETRAKLGAHNLALPLNDITNSTYGLTITTDSDGVSSVSGTATSNGGRTVHVSNAFTLKAGSYKLYSIRSDESIYCAIAVSNSSDSSLIANTDTNNVVEFTINADTNVVIGLNTRTGVVYSNGFTVKPMIILASDASNEYTPYAMTNRELTEIATYKKDDTIAISSNPLYLSALFQDSKHLRLTIPINKPISASGATITINSVQIFNNSTYEEISSGLTATAYKIDGIGLYVVIENAADFATFTTFANATIRFSNASIVFT